MRAHVFEFKYPREFRVDKVVELHEYDQIKYIIARTVSGIGISILDSFYIVNKQIATTKSKESRTELPTHFVLR